MPVTQVSRKLVKEIATFSKLPESAIWVEFPREGGNQQMLVYFYVEDLSPRDIDRLLSAGASNYHTSFRARLVRFLEESYLAEGRITRTRPKEGMTIAEFTPLRSMGGRCCVRCGVYLPDNYGTHVKDVSKRLCRECSEEE